jgi:hypothetical protein
MLLVAVVTVGLFAPGLALAALVRHRLGFTDVAVAPALSIGLYALVGLALETLDRPATRMAVTFGLVLVLAAVGLVSALVHTRRRPAPPPGDTPPDRSDRLRALAASAAYPAGGVALAVAMAVFTWRLPSAWIHAVPHHYDWNWHGFVTATIADRHLLGPGVLVPVDAIDLTPVDPYGYGFHIVPGLVATIGGTFGVVQSLNALTFVISALVAPLGVMALVRSHEPSAKGVLVLVAGVAAVAQGVFYTNSFLPAYTFGVLLVPALLALLTAGVREGERSGLVLAPVALLGLYVTHAQAALTFALALVCVVLVWFLSPSLRSRRKAIVGRLAVVGVATVVLVVPWLLRRLTVNVEPRPTPFDTADAFWNLLVQNVNGIIGDLYAMQSEPVIGVALVCSVLALFFLRRHLDVAVPAVLFAVLYLFAASPWGDVREAVTRSWFGEWYRLFPAYTVLAIVALGLAAHLIAAPMRKRAPRATAITATVAVVAVAVLTVPAAVRDDQWWLRKHFGEWYQVNPSTPVDTWYVTPGDLAGFVRLAELVPPGQRVLNARQDGSTWMYATEGVAPLVPFDSAALEDPYRVYLVDHFGDLGTDPAIARLLEQYDVCWVYRSRSQQPYDGPRPEWWETGDLSGTWMVYDNGDAQIYRITSPERPAACG